MKRISLLALPAIASLATGVAHAQSTVTLYGIVDAGIAYVHNAQGANGANQSTLVKFNSGNMSGSRWGLRGTEDLGGGLAAIFQLENGFNVGTGALGQGGREFGRKSIVGLSSKTWGTVTLGRQYDPIVDLVQGLTEDGPFGGTFATPGDLDNYDNSLRVSNSVKYTSPLIAGLQFEALYALGGVAGQTGNGQTYSFGASYANGPLSLGAGFFSANGGNTVATGATSRTWTSTSDTLFNTVVNSGFASAKSIQIVRAGAQYVLGAATFGLAYSNTQYAGDSLSTFRSTAKFNSGSGFFNYRFTPALNTGVGYSYTSLTGPASAHYNQVNIGAVYSLSKRTDLYALAGYQKASGKTLGSGGALVDAKASIGSYGVNSGTDTQELAVVGIRHKF
ncbi:MULTISPECIES: porin [Burkholderia]|uniref:porin n=1 Tax=Burkholderia TaxID=32008 RepID=UPI000469D586|nr:MULTISPECIES: porin [Burkholderia]NIE87101.1 porin [Burkholderia sp. Tr-860]NIF64976.1 porin [Burkholderia sp. Cy-647]NIF72727.1 porin [Burkholderia sp. Ap-962]NIF89935.1 porin [Burkholderia sp. Cy-637]NIF96783.1 porin [Burkholderia sp. Ax-1720]